MDTSNKYERESKSYCVSHSQQHQIPFLTNLFPSPEAAPAPWLLFPVSTNSFGAGETGNQPQTEMSRRCWWRQPNLLIASAPVRAPAHFLPLLIHLCWRRKEQRGPGHESRTWGTWTRCQSQDQPPRLFWPPVDRQFLGAAAAHSVWPTDNAMWHNDFDWHIPSPHWPPENANSQLPWTGALVWHSILKMRRVFNCSLNSLYEILCFKRKKQLFSFVGFLCLRIVW
jgi:hypothetical protein